MKTFSQKNDVSFFFRANVYILSCLLLFLPLIFSTRTYDNFALHKAVFFHVMVSVLFAFMILGRLHEVRHDVFIPSNALFLPLLFLCASATLSFILSCNVYVSFLGSYQRFDGYWHFLHLIAFYILMVYFFRRLEPCYFSLLIIVPSFFAAMYALCQHYGLDWFSWLSIDRRSISTFGHANTLAGYLAMVFPFVLIEYLQPVVFRKSRFTAGAAGLLCLILYAALLLTFSRAGLLSLAAALFIVLVLVCGFELRKYFFKITVLLFLFASAAFYLNRESKTAVLPVTLRERYLSSVNLHESTVRERILIWDACLKVVRDYPITGAGYEALISVFSKYKSQPLVRLGPDYLADKAHNEYLNAAATTGFIGLAAFLWLILSLIFLAYLSLRRHKGNNTDSFLLSSAFAASLAAYLVNICFGFSTVVTQVYFFLIAAYFTTVMNSDKGYVFSPPERAIGKSAGVRRTFFYVLAGVLILLNISFNISAWAADFYYKKSADAASVNPLLALPYIKRSISLNPLEDGYKKELGRLYGIIYGKNKQPAYFLKAAEVCKDILRHNQHDIDALYSLGNLYFLRGAYRSRVSDFKRAAYYFMQAHERYPAYPVYLSRTGDMYYQISLLQNKKKDKEKWLASALSSAKDSLHIEPRDYASMFLIAKIHYSSRNFEEALVLFVKMMKAYPAESTAYVWAGNIYQEQGKFQDAISCYKKSLSKKTVFSAGVYAEIAKTYFNMNEFTHARQYANKALTFQSHYRPAENILEKIKSRELKTDMIKLQ